MEIIRRAELLKWSKSKYTAELLINWYEQGCPPISSADEILYNHELKVAEEQLPYKSEAAEKPQGGASGSTSPVPPVKHAS